ncbi:dihydrofolate reductase family protein [Streptomyces sp. NBC_01498]|uniref:dihydrofolate reductase family protein n=1 Tax=Streptomyces sp. NBC_01498 TaxID=2975870 RepID=UPI002E7AD905|nr:dihydrofolate reductase family protein [Streptomyces sp. NBC_01498]WTL24699.1 dihydrofolate reductase family protein [Streptomyces sp. NBC_01498]
MRRLSYFIAASIDGFIGDPTGEAAFFTRFVDEEYFAFLKEEFPETLPTQGRRPLGIDHLENKRFDTVIQGRRSYDVARDAGVTSPYAHLRQLVASRTLTAEDPAVEIVSGDVVARVRELKREDGLDIYLCGGATLAGALRDEVDELIVKSYPVLLGSGMPMFGSDCAQGEFTLEAHRVFGNGVTVRTYGRKR